jgi:hypothetical protein
MTPAPRLATLVGRRSQGLRRRRFRCGWGRWPDRDSGVFIERAEVYDNCLDTDVQNDAGGDVHDNRVDWPARAM